MTRIIPIRHHLTNSRPTFPPNHRSLSALITRSSYRRLIFASYAAALHSPVQVDRRPHRGRRLCRTTRSSRRRTSGRGARPRATTRRISRCGNHHVQAHGAFSVAELEGPRRATARAGPLDAQGRHLRHEAGEDLEDLPVEDSLEGQGCGRLGREGGVQVSLRGDRLDQHVRSALDTLGFTADGPDSAWLREVLQLGGEGGQDPPLGQAPELRGEQVDGGQRMGQRGDAQGRPRDGGGDPAGESSRERSTWSPRTPRSWCSPSTQRR